MFGGEAWFGAAMFGGEAWFSEAMFSELAGSIGQRSMQRLTGFDEAKLALGYLLPYSHFGDLWRALRGRDLFCRLLLDVDDRCEPAPQGPSQNVAHARGSRRCGRVLAARLQVLHEVAHASALHAVAVRRGEHLERW